MKKLIRIIITIILFSISIYLLFYADNYLALIFSTITGYLTVDFFLIKNK